MAKITTSLFGDLNLITLTACLPASATLSFLTDVQKSIDESENRKRVRDVQRRVVTYNYSADDKNSIETFNTLYAAIRDKIALPVWSDIQKVGEVLDDATAITCDTIYHDLRANSLALLWACNSFQVVEIGTITDTQINVTNDLVYIKNAYLLPIRLAHINGDVVEKYLNYGRYYQVTFNTDDEVLKTISAPTQFLGDDIYLEPFLVDSDGYSTTSISNRDDRFDNKIGEVSYLTQVANSKLIRNYRVITDTLADNKASQDIIYRSAGQFKPFWMPTFKQDFRCTSTGLITNTIHVESNAYDQFNTRKHIAIQLTDYSWLPVIVLSNTSPVDGIITLTLSAAIDINASQIRCISYLGLNRFNSDDFTLNYLGNGVLETTNVLIEIEP